MADKPTENIWSVIFSGGRQYLGVCEETCDDKDDWVHVHPCYEITSQLIPVGRSESGAPILSKNISAEPVLLGFHGSRVMLQATGIVRGEDMQPQDQARYKRLATAAEQMATDARMAESNIVAPKGRIPGA